MKKGLLLIAGLMIGMSVWGQITISSSSAVSQNFDGIGTTATATLPSGFVVSTGTVYSAGTAATTLAYGTTGTGAVTGTSGGGVINWANGITASATDRSVGFLTSGSFSSPRSIMVKIQNTSGSTISDISIAFDYEKYRTGTRQFDWTFFTGTGTDASTTWTSRTSGDQSFPADANNTTINNPPTTTSKTVTLSGINLANNGTIYLRWTYTGLAGATNSQGMGVDNIVITPTLAVPNAAPTASAVSFSGTLTEGKLLTGSYTYADTESDPQGTSTFKWYASTTSGGAGKTAIGGATASTYTLTSAEIGKFISFEVTPVASTGTSPGTAVESSINASAVIANSAPTASAVSFSGTLTQGQLLTGAYTYSDADSDPEGTSTFKWYRSDDALGTVNHNAIGGATALTYTLALADVGKYISFEVTPKASSGNLTGTAVESAINGTAVLASSNDAPTASAVSITGTLHDGQTLTGHYTYGDTESDPEGTSTFKWYRSNDGSGSGKAAIGGATSSTYILTTTDYNKYISFEVTPVASSGTTTGSAVESGYSGPVANDAPVASSVTFTGTLTEGQLLTGSYSYSDTEGNTQGTSTFKWYRSDDASGTNKAAISGATSSTYTLASGDVGKYISFEVTPVASAGNLTGAAVESSLQGAVAAIPVPTVSVDGTLSNFGSVDFGSSSAEQSFSVSGTNLSANLVVTAPTGFQVSQTSGSGFGASVSLSPSSGTVNSTTIYVKLTPTGSGPFSGNVTVASTGATTQTIAVSGTGVYVVISEVYGGGGNTGAPYQNDFVELYNPTGGAINLTGWSIQYASATGNTWAVTNLTGSIAAKSYYLVQEASGGSIGVALPTADVTGSLNLSGTAGKVILCNTITGQTGTNPTGSAIIDKVGFGGTANGFETAFAPAPSNTTSIERKANSSSTASSLGSGADLGAGNGYDSNDNSADFVAQTTLSPQNSSSGKEPNTAPTASVVTFTGNLSVGQLLTGSYTYSDAESDVEGTSTFKWYQSDDGSGTNKAAIGGATSLTYTLVSGDNGKYISFEVTPKAATGVATGTAVESSLQGPVANPTTVQFGSATSSVAESGGTIDLTVSIANPSGSVATTVDVALTSGTGSTADINAYTTQTVTFPAGSSTPQTVTLTVTDDALMEGNETLVFSLQNVTGGTSATLGAQTTHTLTITDNDNASITLSGSATESSENGAVITVNLTNDTFEPSLTTGNWAVTNLPAGVTKGMVTRVSDTQATIALSGNRTTDYDTNFSPVVTIDHAELVTTASGSVTANSGFTLTATDDAESITVASDGNITEGSEAGEILTVTLVGGTITLPIIQGSWTLNNLPAGLSKGTVTYVDATHVTIAITGTATDYDSDSLVTVTVIQDQIDDYGGPNLTSTNNVVFTAVVEAVPAGFFSEYVEGTSNNKVLEIYNNSGSAIDLAAGNYKVEIYFNGGLTPGTPITLTGTVAAHDVFVISHTSAAAGILAVANQTSGSLTFNGDDAIVLKAGTEVLDVIGQIGLDPGTEWGTGLFSTADNTIRRKTTVTTGDSNGSNTFDPSTEWDGFAIDSFDDLGLPPSQPNPTNGSFSNVTIDGPTTLTGNLTVSGTLTIGASLNTGANSINLGTSGTLSGETTTHYVIGTVNANPTLSGSSPVAIAGLGLTINPNGNNLGSTVVTRRTGTAVMGVGLNRRWTITPTSQPSGAVNVTITWPSGDDNGLNLSNLYIYKSEDNGATWQIHAGPLSTASNPRSLSFTTASFSDWTVGDGDSPLPIELLSWTATPGNGKVNLNWETASELKHAGFEVLRSTKEKTDFRLVASYTSTTELRPKSETGGKYALVDAQVVNGVTYYYKLVDVALDGKRTEHKVLSVIPTDGKPQQPGYEAPIEFKISSIYPNPFNPTTNLVFDLPKDGLVTIRLYNVIGQEVKVIRNEIMKKGRENLVTITTDNLPSGVYMVMVEFGGQRLTKKLTFLK